MSWVLLGFALYVVAAVVQQGLDFISMGPAEAGWALLTLVAFGSHAWLEWRRFLAGYLCTATGQDYPPRWLAPVLTGLALLLTAGPLLATMVWPDSRRALLSFLAGAVLADAFSTHVVPSLVADVDRPSPAIETVPAYLLVAYHYGLEHHALVPLALGAASFLGLWPLLLVLRFGRWLREYLS